MTNTVTSSSAKIASIIVIPHSTFRNLNRPGYKRQLGGCDQQWGYARKNFLHTSSSERTSYASRGTSGTGETKAGRDTSHCGHSSASHTKDRRKEIISYEHFASCKWSTMRRQRPCPPVHKRYSSTRTQDHCAWTTAQQDQSPRSRATS